MSPSYPELATDFERIERVAVTEEQAFLRTIASGSRLFDVAAEETEEPLAARWSRVRPRSSCTTPRASRSTSPWRWPPRPD